MNRVLPKVFTFFIIAALTNPHGAAASALDDYMRLATGSFTSAAQAATDSRYDLITWHVAEIWNGDSEQRWLYIESWMDAAEAPYMQRISRVQLQDDGTLRLQRYQLPETSRFVGAWQDPPRFSTLSPDALTKLNGCDIVLVRAGTDRFEGGTRGNDCRNSYKGAGYTISQSVLSTDEMWNWDRGFSQAGDLVWGPSAGGYRFRRAGADSQCVKPVRMLVYGEVHDRDRFLAYARAIAASSLYPDNDGYYEAITPALDVFEGDPPPGRAVLITRFPCLEAAQAFWHSDQYAKIRPLREGVADFEVLVLPAPPLPEWVD